MADLKIRNLPKDVIVKLDGMAKGKGLSRENFLRLKLEEFALSPELNAVEDKYENIVLSVMEVIQANNELLEKNAHLLNELMIQEAEKGRNEDGGYM